MRLDDAPGSRSRSGEAREETNPSALHGSRGWRSLEPTRAPVRGEPKPGGAIALALERAEQKK